MDYYQNRTPQQYSASSTSQTGTNQSSQGTNYMYGANSNSMYYQSYQQPSIQQSYGTTPQHYTSQGMNSAQTHAQTGPHVSAWNNDYLGTQQQTASGTNQRRGGSQHQQGSYRSTAPSQSDSQSTGMGMPRVTPVQTGPPQLQQQDLPLRMVVEAKFVGAIIGQGGNNIRDITKESKARCVVDVQRAVRDSCGNIEKVISILGAPENCSKACVKILEVIQKEGEKEEKPPAEIELKLRAHNQLVGRLIGKGGATIKKIMQDTGTVIFVSNDPASGQVGGPAAVPYGDVLQMERTITVRAPTIQEVSAAEQKISAKLRQSFETDVTNRMPYGHGVGIPGMPMMNPIGDAYAALAAGMGSMRMSSNSLISKTTKMYVPNSMVGAIIGTKGAHIRNIMRNSGAHIRIEGGEHHKKEKDEEGNEEKESKEIDPDAHEEIEKRDRNSDEERLVTITGNEAQQYRAQFWIFQRIAEQSQHYLDEVKLRTEVPVPSKLVGRIIGKGGQNVRELQRITGAQVKIPDDANVEPGSSEQQEGGFARKEGERSSGSPGAEDDTVVRIIGNFQATQSVQMRVSQLVNEFAKMSNSDRRERTYRDERGEKSVDAGAMSPSNDSH